MNRKKVTSSNIISVGYDGKTETLEVEFIRSGVYQYSDVPKDVYEDFIKASSIGKFFYANIKEKYSYNKV